MSSANQPFDFQAHQQAAVIAYLRNYAFYKDFAIVMKRIIEDSIVREGIKVHSVEARAKDPVSFGRKAALPSAMDPEKPKYPEPLSEITDLVGVRIITYFPSTLNDIGTIIGREFVVLEHSDKSADLIAQERFGYQSLHYLVRLQPRRADLPEYRPFANVVTEIQIRTILQHAWAEIEHDIQYKSVSLIPNEIRRRFAALAGTLELLDHEFQSIHNEDIRLGAESRTRAPCGEFRDMEIRPETLKSFLDFRLGPDVRIVDQSYEWEAQRLRDMGFSTLGQVYDCIEGYSDERLSQIIRGTREMQIMRFDYMLLAGMGENYPTRDPFYQVEIFGDWVNKNLALLKNEGIYIRNYDPSGNQPW